MKGFKKTRIPNLVRHVAGGYYVRVRTGDGRQVCRSLETTVEAIARLRLPGKLAELRAAAGRRVTTSITLEECWRIYRGQLELRGFKRGRQAAFRRHKARSLDYRDETWAAIAAAWPGWGARKAADVRWPDCQSLAERLAVKFKSETRFNGCIQTLRGVLAVAVENGLLAENPALRVPFRVVTPKERFIPSREDFLAILAELDKLPARRFARLNVRALAFTGLRPREARFVTAEDVNLAAGTLRACETKNGQPRTLRLIPQAIELFQREGLDTVLEALRKSPRKALNTICRTLEMPRLTPYTMRHLHLTALVESGVDIGVAADIAGHQDRGVTLLKHYRHGREEHIRKEIGKVKI